MPLPVIFPERVSSSLQGFPPLFTPFVRQHDDETADGRKGQQQPKTHVNPATAQA